MNFRAFCLGIIAVCAALLAGPAFAQSYTTLRPEPQGFTPYQEHTSGPLRSEYLRAARRWPTALSCLQPSQRTSPTPDLARVNWTAIRSELDAEACLFRIFEVLVTPAQAQHWLASQRMHDIRARQLPRQQHSQIEVCGSNDPHRTGRVLVQADQTAGMVAQYLYGGETFCGRYTRTGRLLSTRYIVKGQGDYPQDDRILLPRQTHPHRPPARPVYKRRAH